MRVATPSQEQNLAYEQFRDVAETTWRSESIFNLYQSLVGCVCLQRRGEGRKTTSTARCRPQSRALPIKRQRVQAYPTSVSTLTQNWTRIRRIKLGGGDFVDPASVRLMRTISGTGRITTSVLVATSGHWGIWSQVCLIPNGVALDTTPMYGLWHQLFCSG